MSRAYAAQEAVEDACSSYSDDPQGLVAALTGAASEAREVAEEYRASVSNMPESLQSSSQADEMNEKADNLDVFADALESAASDIENMDVPDQPGDDPAVCEQHHASKGNCDCEQCEAHRGWEEASEIYDNFRDEVIHRAEEAAGELSL